MLELSQPISVFPSVGRPAPEPADGEALSGFSTTVPEGGDQTTEPTPANALQALAIFARLHHVADEPGALRHEPGLDEHDAVSRDDLLLAAKHIGLKAEPAQSGLTLAPLPALAVMADSRSVVLAQCNSQRVLFMGSSAVAANGALVARPTIELLGVFASQWTGELILVARRTSLAGRSPYPMRLFALVSPLFFQVVMGEALVHKGLTTLDVSVIGFVVIMIFVSALTVLHSSLPCPT